MTFQVIVSHARRLSLPWSAPRISLFALGLCLLASISWSTEGQLRLFDLPRDTADKSLKRFSEQSGLEVIFSSRVAKAVRTSPVKGEMTPEQALETMLTGTGLVVVRESKSGAFSVRRETAAEKKKDQSTGQVTSGTRPGI
jgi:hypothetical protein